MKKLTIRELTIFAMLGAVLFALKLLFELLPNIHPIAMLIATYTAVYRKKALIPLYVFILLSGIFYGFAAWWLPYIYIWTILWAICMLIPKNLSKKASFIVYPIVLGLYGILYGTLYAPAEALIFGLSFKGMISWILAGLPFDALHAAGNMAMGFVVYPLTTVLNKLEQK